jgi:pyruvate dehydrogenase E1 component alpha subunit
VPGVIVDGNDVVAVYKAALAAVEHARRGRGPTLIEIKTYRWREHVGPNYDVGPGGRARAELDAWMAQDPLATLAGRLEQHRVLLADDRETLDRAIEEELEDAVAFAKASPFPDAAALYADVD